MGVNEYILAIDQGTTSTRAMVFDSRGTIVGKGQQEFSQIYPQPGWVEHRPDEIWHSTLGVTGKALQDANIRAEQIAGIGITNQRETVIIWDRKTGEPIYNAIVWQCRRSKGICARLKENGFEEMFKEKTGLLLDPYFSGTKINWLLDNVPGARKKAQAGDLIFGTVDSWLVWKLTGGKVHITDYTNASRTLIFNIHSLEWDNELLEILNIPVEILPQVRSCSEIYGKTDPGVFFGADVPISGIAGDQQAATFAQGCYQEGMTKITYGTGGFMLMNTGKNAVISENGLLTTIGWGLGEEVNYALEGSIFVAGAAIQWLRDELRILDDAVDSDYFANRVESTDGIYFVPAFIGLGAPYWEPDARGMIVGLTRGASKNHLIRAALESLVYQSKDVLKAMTEDSNVTLKNLRVDGGASANNFMLQFLSDITGSTVERPVNTETTAAGAAYLAGLAVGYWDDLRHLQSIHKIERVFEQEMADYQAAAYYDGWKKAVKTALYWSKI